MNVRQENAMSYDSRVAELEWMLAKTESQLERWANESRSGGWSTHQVDPMRKLADDIRRVLGGVVRK